MKGVFFVEDRVTGAVGGDEIAIEGFDVDGHGLRKVIHHIAHLGVDIVLIFRARLRAGPDISSWHRDKR